MQIVKGLLFVGWIIIGVCNLTDKRDGVSKISYGCVWLCLIMELALMRLIDADKIKIPYKRDDIYYRNTYSSGVTAMVHAIGKTPTIEADPVVHGRWILDEYGNPHCSVCEHV